MLSVRDLSLLQESETPTPMIARLPNSAQAMGLFCQDVGPTGTAWGSFEVFFSPAPLSQPSTKSVIGFETLSLNIIQAPGLSYIIRRPIPVVIEQDEGSFVASFNEANIHASGDTMERALTNLKTYIGDVLDELLELGTEVLGSVLQREFAILQTYIQKRNAK